MFSKTDVGKSFFLLLLLLSHVVVKMKCSAARSSEERLVSDVTHWLHNDAGTTVL